MEGKERETFIMGGGFTNLKWKRTKKYT